MTVPANSQTAAELVETGVQPQISSVGMAIRGYKSR